jgi:hypothetical protein
MSDSELQHKALDGITEYIAALDSICALAQLSLFIFENDFDSLGFNSETRYNTLRKFLLSSPNVRLKFLAHDVQPIVRYCPRIMLLQRQFSHIMNIYQTPVNLRHLTAPFAVADSQHFVRRFHFDNARGEFAQHEPEGAIVLKSRFEEMWAASRQNASITTLGL